MCLLHASTGVHPCTAADYLVQCCGAISPQVVVQPFVQALWVLRVPQADGRFTITRQDHPTSAALGGGFPFGKIQAAACGNSQQQYATALWPRPGNVLLRVKHCLPAASAWRHKTGNGLEDGYTAACALYTVRYCTVDCCGLCTAACILLQRDCPASFHHSQQYHGKWNLQVHKEEEVGIMALTITLVVAESDRE